MKSADKIKRYGFRETLLTLNLWFISVSYHIITFYLAYFSLIRKTSEISPSSTVSGLVEATIRYSVEATRGVLIPKEGKPINPYLLAISVQILIFNIFFLLIFFLLGKLNNKIYNPGAIYLVGITTSLIFILIAALY